MSIYGCGMIVAHGGGELADLRASQEEALVLRGDAAKLPAVKLGARELANLELLASGAFSPLTGFMEEVDYIRSRDNMRLASGAPWPIQITLDIDEDTTRALRLGVEIALADESGSAFGILKALLLFI
jgi:sulfate adenylyltransferase